MVNWSFPFPDHTVETAPEAARPALRALDARLGFVPVASARQAEAPALAATFAALLKAWDATAFDAREREVVTFEVAHRVGCDLCIAFHSQIVDRALREPRLLAALRDRAPLPDARLEALRAFTGAVLESRGAVDDGDLAAFLEAGYTPRHALELVVGIAAFTLSTFANRMVRAPVDPQLAAYAPAG